MQTLGPVETGFLAPVKAVLVTARCGRIDVEDNENCSFLCVSVGLPCKSCSGVW